MIFDEESIYNIEFIENFKLEIDCEKNLSDEENDLSDEENDLF